MQDALLGRPFLGLDHQEIRFDTRFNEERRRRSQTPSYVFGRPLRDPARLKLRVSTPTEDDERVTGRIQRHSASPRQLRI